MRYYPTMARQKVSIESEGRTLSGRLFVPQDPNGGAVLFVHGFGAIGRTCEQYAKPAVQKGITSLCFDLGGHGDSTGDTSELSVNDHLADTRNAYDYLVEEQDEVKIDPERIGIAGMSYGGYLAAQVCADRVVKSLLLRSPPLYPERLKDKPRKEYSDTEALSARLNVSMSALSALRSFAGSLILVVSELDTVVVPAITDAYLEAAPTCEQITLKHTGHMLDAASQQIFKPLVTEWSTDL